MLTAILITALVSIGAGVGGTVLVQSGGKAGKHDAEIEASRTEAIAAASKAGAEAAQAVLAPEMARVESLASQLDKLPAAYCDGGDKDHYDADRCLADRICTRAGVTGDGGDAVGCERALNLVLSQAEITTVEESADKETAQYRAGVFQRRK